MPTSDTRNRMLQLALSWLAMLMLVMAGWTPMQASAQGANPKFEHFKTGFPLSGSHTTTRCESCHINGVFKGTPRDCQTCHTTGSRFSRANATMPSNHIPVSVKQTCDSCHGTQAFSGVRFSHSTMTAGASCQSCHDGIHSPGKPSNHIPTRANCETCHTSSSWSSNARPDHSTFTTATDCVGCHNGGPASGKPSGHIPVSANCVSCHAVTSWKPTNFNHTQVNTSGQCATCHTGNNPPADGKHNKHIPTSGISGIASASCDSCHKGGFSAWSNGKFHANNAVSGQCATCHLNGANFDIVGKPNNSTHASVTGNCEKCHATGNSWAVSKVDHSQFNASTTCSSCHNGTGATGKPTTHVPTSVNCLSCHTTSAWKPSKWNHTQDTSTTCSTCHSNPYATSKPSNHIPVSSGCNSCHGTTSWKPSSFNHTQVSTTGQCATCHSGSNPPADSKPANHIPTTATVGVNNASCDTCHKGSLTSWATGKFHNNVTVVGQCAACHLTAQFGLTAKPNNNTHSGVTGNCEQCHKTSGWAGATVDHSKFTSATQCASCHNGTTATGKDNSHIPVTGNCTKCHSTSGWKPTSWNHTQESVTQCATCHNGVYSTTKPGNHIPVTAVCSTCHTTTSFKPSSFNHTQVSTAGQCATCHTGMNPPAGGKALSHIPTTATVGVANASCDTCHKGGFTGWNNALFHNNVSVVGQCASCHMTNQYGLTSKPSNSTHSGVTGNCEQCHKTSGWAGATVDHSKFTSATQCASCHNGTTATGKDNNHIPVTGNCTKCHSTSRWTPTSWNHTQESVTQCATCHNGVYSLTKPGNHIPVTAVCSTCHTTASFKPSSFNHTQVNTSGQCATCHTGMNPPADGKPMNHVPTTTTVGVTNNSCDTCHKGSLTTWSTGKFHNNVTVIAQCASCHLTPQFGLTSKPNNATHSAISGNCEQCHKTSGWTGARVNHSTFNATTQCGTCHNGNGATGKPGNHVPTTANCISCHSTSVWTPANWTHTQIVVTNQCASCHTGGYANADGRPGNHIPYQSITASAAANCDTCHRGSFKIWSNGQFHANVTVTGQCASCHTGGFLGPDPKPGNHIPYQSVIGSANAGCETCHKGGFNSWASGKFHANVNVTGQCATCHNGSYLGPDKKPGNHIPYQSVGASVNAGCETCHKGSFTSWATGKFHNNVTVTTQCKTCHMGGFLGATMKPTNHIPESQLLNGTNMECNACHKSTAAGGFGTTVMDHNNSQGNGSGYCYACHRSGTAFLGPMERKSLTHRKSTGVFDCSQSGCHRPVGNEGTTYRSW